MQQHSALEFFVGSPSLPLMLSIAAAMSKLLGLRLEHKGRHSRSGRAGVLLRYENGWKP